MMRKNKIAILLAFMLLTFFWHNRIQAQKSDIYIMAQDVYRQGDSVFVDLTFLSTKLSSNYRIDLKPVIYNKTYELSLAPARIVGRRHSISLRRHSMSKSRKTRYQDNNTRWQTVRSNDTLYYSTAFAYEPWMKTANIRIDRDLVGCCRIKVQPPLFLYDYLRISEPLVNPTPSSILLVERDTLVILPDEEYIESISIEEYIANTPFIEEYIVKLPIENLYNADDNAFWIYFNEDGNTIDLNYRNNLETLNRIERRLRAIAQNEQGKTTRILAIGYCSIYGSYAVNQLVGEQRAMLMRNTAVSYGISPENIDIINKGEAWDILRSLIATSALPDKEEILHIIDTVPIMYGRERKLMDIDDGMAYRWMRKNLFPELRKAGFIIEVY